MNRFSLLTAALTLVAAPALAAGNLLLTSPLVQEGAELPRSAAGNINGCNGQNISPTLDWSGAPEGTKSYALSLFDPDAPDGGAVHWVVLNIPPIPSTLPPDSGNPDKLPQGVNVLPNSFGTDTYVGPCSPDGQLHRYEFTLYAMPDAQVFYPLSAVGPSTIQWLHDHAIESTTLTVKYGR
jgi:hypothetical protein